MVDRRLLFDRDRPLVVAGDVGHTRWHPDIPPIATIRCGEVVEIDVRDGGDRQMATDPQAPSDIDRLHPLTGPFAVERAAPGDLLTVELLALEADDFGWTAIRRHGKGLMGDSRRAGFHHHLAPGGRNRAIARPARGRDSRGAFRGNRRIGALQAADARNP